MGRIEPADVITRHRLTVAEYERMGEVGLLGPTTRTELIRGEIVDMAPIGSRHGGCVKLLNHRFSAAVGDGAVIAIQDPVHLNAQSAPQPDLMVLRPQADGYMTAHPGPADVLLLIEVSDTTARYDREVKLPLYAAAGIEEVWIVDLESAVLRLHRKPLAGEYAEIQLIPNPGVLSVPGVPGATVDLSGLLPAAP
jgi:Uma2 family endonuclease